MKAHLYGNQKIRSTATSSSSTLGYRFHSLEPLQHLPNPSSALAILTKLSNDPAILHIMEQHKFSVGLLTELAPHENPGLLGLNVNAGQAIKLRIRTDAYDGFRLYREIRKVLCHELTHNVWSDHGNDVCALLPSLASLTFRFELYTFQFKELNSKLNKEVVEFERSASEGTHDLLGDGDVYEPSSELEAEAHVHVLGGGGMSSLDESREDRRRRVLEATMKRLRKEEEELEQSCGTAGPSVMRTN